jgi:excisionase family DNA binding protein
MKARAGIKATQRDTLKSVAADAGKLSSSRQAALMDEIDARENDETAALFRDPHRSVVTLAEIANAYGVHVRTLLRHIEAGELEALKIGRAYKVSRKQLGAWIRRRKV